MIVYYPPGASRRNREFEEHLAAMTDEDREAYLKAQRDAAMQGLGIAVIILPLVCAIFVIAALIWGG